MILINMIFLYVENMFLKDERSVCNAYNVSAVSLNPFIEEVEAFAKL